jgi:hypothetical protein
MEAWEPASLSSTNGSYEAAGAETRHGGSAVLARRQFEDHGGRSLKGGGSSTAGGNPSLEPSSIGKSRVPPGKVPGPYGFGGWRITRRWRWQVQVAADAEVTVLSHLRRERQHQAPTRTRRSARSENASSPLSVAPGLRFVVGILHGSDQPA